MKFCRNCFEIIIIIIIKKVDFFFPQIYFFSPSVFPLETFVIHTQNCSTELQGVAGCLCFSSSCCGGEAIYGFPVM